MSESRGLHQEIIKHSAAAVLTSRLKDRCILQIEQAKNQSYHLPDDEHMKCERELRSLIETRSVVG